MVVSDADIPAIAPVDHAHCRLYPPQSPSISIISPAIYNPLTYKKRSPSFMDFFFMEKPQEYLSSSEITPTVKEEDDGPKQMIKVIEDGVD